MPMILRWDAPKKKLTDEAWRSISADGAPPGVYTPNMSDEDAKTWRAKKIGGKDPRVEIRVLKGSQMLVVVRPEGYMTVSMNGPMLFTPSDWADFQSAVEEAREVLKDGLCQVAEVVPAVHHSARPAPVGGAVHQPAASHFAAADAAGRE